MTTLTVVVGAVNVSGAVKRVKIRRVATEGVGSFQILLDNKNGQYSGVFAGDEAVSITVDGAVLFKGYVDNVEPYVEQSLQAKFQQLLILTGRCYGQDLQNKFYDGVYNAKADDIIADLLSKAGSEISFTSPSTAPVIYYDSKGAFLLDSFREILEYVDYDGFVDVNKVWNMFPVGTVSSGITLKSVAGASDNNVLKIVEHTEKDLYELRNYIIVFGPKVDDGWTEMNAADWVGGSGNTVSNYIGTDPTAPRKGISAVKCEKGTGERCELKLAFPKYNYNSLDWSKLSSGELSVHVYGYRSGIPRQIQAAVALKDDEGHEIDYPTTIIDLDVNPWGVVVVPVGSGCDINVSSGEGWHPHTGTDTAFTWKIVEIKIWDFSTVADWILMDGLTLPNQMIAVSQDGASQGLYKTRKMIVSKTDVDCQKALQAYADSVKAKRKDPLERLYLAARGDVGLIGGVWKWLPGYNVTVNIPLEKLNDASFRMIEIHHVIEKDAAFGFDHIVELSMVPASAKLDTQRWSYREKGQIGLLRRLHDRLRFKEQEALEVRDWYPALPKPIWEIYGPQVQKWEGEDRWIVKESGTVVVNDVSASGGKCIKRPSTASSGYMWTGPAKKMGGMEFYAIFRMKVGSNVSGSAVITVDVYSYSANPPDGAVLASIVLKPNMFPESNKWHHFALRVGSSPEWSDLELRGRDFVSGITDVFMDWVGIQPADVPLSLTDLTNVSGSDSDSAASEQDADSAVESGTHTHDIAHWEEQTGVTSGHSHSYSISAYGTSGSGAHTHGVNSPLHGHGITSPSHGHSHSDPKHKH